MASGEARVWHRLHKKPVCIGRRPKIWWSPVWDNVPFIQREPSDEAAWLLNAPGSRPYVASCDRDRFTWNEDYRAPYGTVVLTDAEREWAGKQITGDYIVVEPDIKDENPQLFLGRNKAWKKWDQLLKLDYPWVQLGQKKARTRQVKTENIRQALAILAGARLFVGTDGALHHAAAALGVPAVVLWGGLVSPRILGYPTHTNIWHGDKPCGTHRFLCPHCTAAMDKITVDEVRKAVG